MHDFLLVPHARFGIARIQPAPFPGRTS